MTAYLWTLVVTALTSAGCLGLAWKASRKWEPQAWKSPYGTLPETWVERTARGQR